jgi:hypothetical protein
MTTLVNSKEGWEQFIYSLTKTPNNHTLWLNKATVVYATALTNFADVAALAPEALDYLGQMASYVENEAVARQYDSRYMLCSREDPKLINRVACMTERAVEAFASKYEDYTSSMKNQGTQ